MAEVTITIGGRAFQVVCQEGQEQYLYSAAEMLDTEAAKLDQAGTRITESRMLLMAGLMLADRTAALEEKVSAADATDVTAAVAQEQAKAQRAEAALAEEQVKAQATQQALDVSRSEMAGLQSTLARLQADKDDADIAGGKDVHAELEASRAEVESLTQRLATASAAPSAQADSISNELLSEARSKRDEAVEALDAAVSAQQTAQAQHEAAVTSLQSVQAQRDEAVSTLEAAQSERDTARASLEEAEGQRDTAIAALRRVVDKIEAVAD